MIHTRMNIYLEMPPKNGKKVGIHFYENVLSEMNLPLTHTNQLLLLTFFGKIAEIGNSKE